MRKCIIFILTSFCSMLWAEEFDDSWLDEKMSQSSVQVATIMLDADLTVTTASKRKQKLKDVPAIISVLRNSELRNQGARTLEEALNLVAGVDVNRGIMLGTHDRVSVRGRLTDFGEDTLVLLDGQRLNDVYTGGGLHQLKYLSLENVKQIEFIRGPGSSIYGSNAFVGVVNIITYSPGELIEKAHGGTVAFSGGSFDRYGGALNLIGKRGELAASAHFNYQSDDGDDYDFSKGYFRQPGLSYSVDDPREGWNAGAKLRYVNFSFDVDLFDRSFEGFLPAGFLSNSWNSSILETNMDESKLLRAQGKYSWKLSDQLEIVPMVKYSKGEVEGHYYLAQPMNPMFMGTSAYDLGWFGAARHETENLEFEAQLNYTLEKHSIVAGVVSQQEKLVEAQSGYNVFPFAMPPLDFGSSIRWLPEAYSFAEENDRDVLGVYFQDTWSLSDALGLTLGVRYDDYSDFGDSTNPRVGLVYQVSDKTTLKALMGMAFRAPTFNELYIRLNPVEEGNPNLDAQTIATYETQLIYRASDRQNISLSIFWNQYEDLIRLEGREGSAVPLYVNAHGEEEDVGFELEYRYQVSPFKYFTLNYSYVDPEDANGETRPDIAQSKGAFVFNWDVLEEKVILNLNGFYRGDRESQSSQIDEVDDVFVLGANVRVLNVFDTPIEWSFGASNLTDEEWYSPSYSGILAPEGIPNRGVEFYTELRFKY